MSESIIYVAKEKLGDQRMKKFFDQILSPSIFDTSNSINSVSGNFQQQILRNFRNIMLSKNELARVKTILTTIKVQLKFGYFITCNGIPVVTTSSFNIFVRRAKWYRISRCRGLQIKKKNTPKFRPSDNSIEKKNIFNFCQTSSSVKI